jgi:hypothetical protein
MTLEFIEKLLLTGSLARGFAGKRPGHERTGLLFVENLCCCDFGIALSSFARTAGIIIQAAIPGKLRFTLCLLSVWNR